MHWQQQSAVVHCVTLLSSVHSEVSGLLLLSYIGNGQQLLDGRTGIGQGQGGAKPRQSGREGGSAAMSELVAKFRETQISSSPGRGS